MERNGVRQKGAANFELRAQAAVRGEVADNQRFISGLSGRRHC